MREFILCSDQFMLLLSICSLLQDFEYRKKVLRQPKTNKYKPQQKYKGQFIVEKCAYYNVMLRFYYTATLSIEVSNFGLRDKSSFILS